MLLETYPGPLIVPTLVITEVVYLVASRLGTQAELRFLGDVASGAFDGSRSTRLTGCASRTWSAGTATFRSVRLMPQ